MHAVRTFFLRHRSLAFAVIALALAMKVLLPAGFMAVAEGKTISVMVCDGHGDLKSQTIALAGQDAGSGGETGMAKAAKACPYSVLSSAALGGADIALVAALLLFILATGFLPAACMPLRRASFLTPPSCGPPALA